MGWAVSALQTGNPILVQDEGWWMDTDSSPLEAVYFHPPLFLKGKARSTTDSGLWGSLLAFPSFASRIASVPINERSKDPGWLMLAQ